MLIKLCKVESVTEIRIITVHYFALISIQQIPTQRNIENLKKNDIKEASTWICGERRKKGLHKKISRYNPFLPKILLIPEFTREKGMKAEPSCGDSLKKQGQVFAD